MMRIIFGAVALGLIWCQHAAAQKAHVVYVDIDFTNAKELANRPRATERSRAYDDLRERLTTTFKSIRRLPCWELQPLPDDPKKRPAAYHSIRVYFYITSSGTDTSELKAVVKLTASSTTEELPLHGGELILLGAAQAQDVINKYWSDANKYVASNFQRVFPLAGSSSGDILCEAKVPIAHGIQKLTPGGALLPINDANFRTHPQAKFDLEFLGKAVPKLWISSRCDSDRAARFLRVVHELWDNKRAYDPAKDDPALKLLASDAVLVKDFGPYVIPRN
jgi:hypothetical protein